MSLNPCSKNIARLRIQELQLAPEKIDIFLEELDKFVSKRLYASYIRRFFGINPTETFKIINALLDLGIIIPKYQIKLGSNYLPKSYNNLIEIPLKIVDEETYETIHINFEKNVFVFYKVIADE
ncbi:TPA: hypothetical protein QFV23_001104 [Enterococcus faecium]|uniref:hypothetical protein n=1 Tax=Enterococcus faecium TaxID=1352 RepID=UPI000CF2FEA2|nr:hypothetical protein [Enterococcus faecium]PQG18300.1 hypothetical protein CUS22_07185 [Enterococcus faecium]HAQ2179930.1 hypothetical protein [Enterococcus faecium]